MSKKEQYVKQNIKDYLKYYDLCFDDNGDKKFFEETYSVNLRVLKQISENNSELISDEDISISDEDISRFTVAYQNVSRILLSHHYDNKKTGTDMMPDNNQSFKFIYEKLQEMQIDDIKLWLSELCKKEDDELKNYISINLKEFNDFKKIIQQKDMKAGKKHSKREVLGKTMVIYKIPGDRKEYVKHKGKLITVKDYKELMKAKKSTKKTKKK